MEPAAIVTDASERIALHVIRALGRAGVRVIAVEMRGRSRWPMAFYSRYTRERHLIEHWDVNEEKWADDLASIGAPGDVLMLPTLNSLRKALTKQVHKRSKFRILAPPLSTIEKANNKWHAYSLAKSLGVPVPQTYAVGDLSELREAASEIGLPLVLKLCHDVDVYLPAARRCTIVQTPEELEAAWQALSRVQQPLLAQSYVRGEGYGFEAVYDQERRLVAFFCHRRLVEYPISGGPSAVCESVKEETLINYGRRILEALEWRGVAMVEFRRCSRSGQFFFLEVNPRFWGSLPLAEAAGVNFPHILFKLALGEEASPLEGYRTGVRMRFGIPATFALLQAIRHKPMNVRRILRIARNVLSPWVREGLVTADDPIPGLFYVLNRVGIPS